MKNLLSFLAVATMFVASSAASASELGKQIDFLKDGNGQPKFLVRHVYDSYLKHPIWAINFSVDGQNLSEGNPVRIISWRLWDKQNEAFLNNPGNFFESIEDDYLAGEKSFGFGVGFADKAKEAILLGERLTLVFFVGSRDARGAPTHFIDLGAYCDAYPELFVDEISGAKGCGVLKKPKIKSAMPSGKGKISINNGMFDAYCKAAKSVAEDAAKAGANAPLGYLGGVKREMKLANLVCGKDGKFKGLSDLEKSSQDTRAISLVAIVENGFAQLAALESLLRPGSFSASRTWFMSFSQNKQIFYDSQLFEVYPDLNGELREVYLQVENQALELANFYRDQ